MDIRQKILNSDIPLEDEWYSAQQEANQANHKYQTLYRLKEHVMFNMAKEKLESAKKEGLKMTKTSSIEEVKASEEHRDYIKDMVDAEQEYRDLKAKADYIEKIYFGAKQAEKSERKAYNYHESVSKRKDL
jgi:hypothetical protein